MKQRHIKSVLAGLLAGTLAFAWAGAIPETAYAASSSTTETVPVTLKVTVPDGCQVNFGTQKSYLQTALDASNLVINSDNTKTYELQVDTKVSTNTSTGVKSASSAGQYYYRVSSTDATNTDMVTYWGWTQPVATLADTDGDSKMDSIASTEMDITVTADQLHMNDQDADVTYDADTILGLDNNQYEDGNVLLTGNENGYINLSVGDTYNLQAERSWQIIEGIMNNQITEPDFHYEVVDLDGNASDVVSVETLNASGSNTTIKANKEGTAVILVTYDAVEASSVYGALQSNVFSAIWPENTGVFVVSVGQDGTGIADGISLDAELDVQYYTENGASLTFTPAEKAEVTVARPAISDNKMSYSGFSSKGIVTNEDGTVTVNNLYEGSSIIRQTVDGVSTYQVIKARQTDVTYTCADAEGNAIEASQLKAGDSLTLTFSNLFLPITKVAGVYNGSGLIKYTDGTNTYAGAEAATVSRWGSMASYDFATREDCHTVTITIPSDYDGDVYSLTGTMQINKLWGSNAGSHRTVRRLTGLNNGAYNLYASQTDFTSLPAVTISLTGDGVTIASCQELETEEADSSDDSAKEEADSDSKVIVADDDQVKGIRDNTKSIEDTKIPAASGEKTSASTSSTKTGDSTPIALFVILIVVACGIILVVCLRKKKQSDDK